MVVATGSNNNLFELSIVRGAAMLEKEPALWAHMPLPDVSERIATPGLRCSQIIREVLTAYADRPALGDRATEIVEDTRTGERTLSLLPAFQTITYAEVDKRVQSIASFWASDQALGGTPGRLICLMGFASVDYATVDVACTYVGIASVPLQTNMYPEDFVKILKETEAACVVVSIENVEKAVKASEEASDVRCIIVMDYDDRITEQKARFDGAAERLEARGGGVRIVALNWIFKNCAPGEVIPPYVAPAGEDPLTTIFYTSGSTGSPKGAMFLDGLWARWWSSPGLPLPMIQLCYQPLNHGMGRFAVINSLKTGGICYFAAKSDMSTLFEDVRLVRPAVFDFVPRVAELIYHQYNNEVARQVNAGLGAEADIRKAVLEKMRAELLGGRVVSGIIGTAPTDISVAEFIRECFQIPLVDAYGSTESGPLTFNGRVNRNAVVDYQLREVAELGYYPTDKPYPRGELLVKTRSAVAGYFKNPELTAELFKDGYIAMGDIVEEREPDLLVWIDRRNNVQKLAQGEYVAISKVEIVLTGGDSLIKNLYLYGNSKRAYLLAVVVPDMEVAFARLGREPGKDELRTLIRTALSQIAQRENLRTYEVPRDFIIEQEPFSSANGLLSSISKMVRPALKRRYGQALEDLYAEHDRVQADEITQLRAKASERSTRETLVSALTATLGLAQLDLSETPSFADLGGDSLTAVSLSILLEEIFEVPVPVGTILNPVAGIWGIADAIDKARANADSRASFNSVHSDAEATKSILASDYRLDRFIDEQTLDAAAALPLRDGEPAMVLVTGATGFLGRFLCLEWLERLSARGGKVITIVRAANRDEALQRLRDAFDSGDPVLARRFDELAKAHLDVLAGDLSAPQLGLDDDSFARLASEVDLIVHPAALVNHMLGYKQLFEPNVLGTAELIRLALTTRRKRFDFVSTVAVALRDDGTSFDEDEDVRLARGSFRLSSSDYANGYSISKWAGEVLLREAHDHFGIPVNVFRSDMILPHSEYAGQINTPDVFIRLLISVVETGLAPRSFYRLGPDGKPVTAHYDGLPVDFTARAIVAIGASGDAGFHSYNVINPHDDDISLDQIIAWIGESGCDLTRIVSHAEWIERFEAALMRLPSDRRQLSSLPVLDQLRQPMRGDEFAAVPSLGFQSKVAQVRPGGSGAIPQISKPFIAKCVRDVQALTESWREVAEAAA